MESSYTVTKDRIFSKLEQLMIWKKPLSHQTSQEELRIANEIKLNWQDPELKIVNILLEGDAGSGKTQLAKALSADLQLPYTKITCFADMDKADVFGALLPIIKGDAEEDQDLLEAIYQTDSLTTVLDLIAHHYRIDLLAAKERLTDFIQRVNIESDETIQYKYYPSEIVRAVEKGYLLEIQEPTVIRDASVLVALNSALEQNGMINLPTTLIRRHPDCVIVVTTNRNYQGNRPLNESLRDRMQHVEKMDLPEISVMVARGIAKTGVTDQSLLEKMAEIVRLLDQTAKSNAIKGVAGMRSYFYWINTYKNGQNLLDSIYAKVIYKLTTDEHEIRLLLENLENSGLLFELQGILNSQKIRSNSSKTVGRKLSGEEADKRNIAQESAESNLTFSPQELQPDNLETEKEKTADGQREADLKNASNGMDVQEATRSEEIAADQKLAQQGEEAGNLGQGESKVEQYNQAQAKLKKELNKEVRDFLKTAESNSGGLIIHRPQLDQQLIESATEKKRLVKPTVDQLSRKMLDILEKEAATTYQTGKHEGTRFNASRVAYGDFRHFDRQSPPEEQPSLALAVRIDESASMIRDGRIESARLAAMAVGEFAKNLRLPFLLYGDTADRSKQEKTSIFSYKEFSESFDLLDAKIMSMEPRQNNRDGIVLRLIADKLAQESATTKLLLNVSDGQPKALPDYSGKKAQEDIQRVLNDYERQGIIFLSAAIGQDKEIIRKIYGENRFINISQLNEFPLQLVELISRYLI